MVIDIGKRALHFLMNLAPAFAKDMEAEVKWWVQILSKFGNEQIVRSKYAEAIVHLELAIAFREERPPPQNELETLHNLYLSCLTCQLESQVLDEDTSRYLSQCKKIGTLLPDTEERLVERVLSPGDAEDAEEDGRPKNARPKKMQKVVVVNEERAQAKKTVAMVSFHIYCMQNNKEALKSSFAQAKGLAMLGCSDFMEIGKLCKQSGNVDVASKSFVHALQMLTQRPMVAQEDYLEIGNRQRGGSSPAFSHETN